MQQRFHFLRIACQNDEISSILEIAGLIVTAVPWGFNSMSQQFLQIWTVLTPSINKKAATQSAAAFNLLVIKCFTGYKEDIWCIPFDDAMTLELLQKGLIDGIFMFKNEELQKILQALKPNVIDDLPIIVVVQKGATLFYRQGELAGFTGNSVSIKRNGCIFVYDDKDKCLFYRSIYKHIIWHNQRNLTLN